MSFLLVETLTRRIASSPTAFIDRWFSGTDWPVGWAHIIASTRSPSTSRASSLTCAKRRPALGHPRHVKLCAGWGLSSGELEQAPPAVETLAHTRYVLDTGMRGELWHSGWRLPLRDRLRGDRDPMQHGQVLSSMSTPISTRGRCAGEEPRLLRPASRVIRRRP